MAGLNFEGTEISPLIISDCMTVEQWADTLTTKERSPESRLMLAILEDAARCYLEGKHAAEGTKKWNLHNKAYIWLFMDPLPADGALTCREVCEVLHINLEWLRKGLRAKILEPGEGKLQRRSSVRPSREMVA